MSLLTWIAVWLASMLMRAILAPVLGPKIPQVLDAGLVAGVVVVILTWAAMPFLVNLAHPWLHPKSKARNAHKTHRMHGKSMNTFRHYVMASGKHAPAAESSGPMTQIMACFQAVAYAKCLLH